MRPEAIAHVWDAAEAARLVAQFVVGQTEADLERDLLLRSAIERQLEILGEALNRLRRDDPEAAVRVPDLDKVVGMRNVIVHAYGEIDYEIVWSAVTNRLPTLLHVLTSLLDEAGPAPEVSAP